MLLRFHVMYTFAAHKTDYDLYNLYRVCKMYKLDK